MSPPHQLMVNCWFGPRIPIPFIRGFQESKPPGPKPTINHYLIHLIHVRITANSKQQHHLPNRFWIMQRILLLFGVYMHVCLFFKIHGVYKTICTTMASSSLKMETMQKHCIFSRWKKRKIILTIPVDGFKSIRRISFFNLQKIGVHFEDNFEISRFYPPTRKNLADLKWHFHIFSGPYSYHRRRGVILWVFLNPNDAENIFHKKCNTAPETNMGERTRKIGIWTPEKERNRLFSKPSIFRCKLAVSFREGNRNKNTPIQGLRAETH